MYTESFVGEDVKDFGHGGTPGAVTPKRPRFSVLYGLISRTFSTSTSLLVSTLSVIPSET